MSIIPQTIRNFRIFSNQIYWELLFQNIVSNRYFFNFSEDSSNRLKRIMEVPNTNYFLYHKFIADYLECGYKEIDRTDSSIIELEEFTKTHNQFFFISDLLKGQIIFSSQRSQEMFGLDCLTLNPLEVIELVKPDELHRNTKGWAKLLSIANQLLIQKKGESVLSVNMKIRNSGGVFSETLIQCYLFYSGAPWNRVYELQIFTDLSKHKMSKNGYHYYTGNDLSFFRLPDQDLLKRGINLTKREFEILQLIESGLSTKEIASRLFLSKYTVNAHRRNILRNTNSLNISDVIYRLMEQGVI